MGCCSSQPNQPPAGRGSFPAPLPPPMQDNMNELLNRWRHGEVNLLQRKFRQARAPPVKHSIASKILSTLAAAPSSNTGTATSAATSANRDASFGDEGSTSPASRDGAAEADGKKPGDLPAPGYTRVEGGNGDTGEAVPLGDAGGARASMDKEAFLRVFPEMQGLPTDVQRSAFRLFDCVGRGSLDFRNFCRALALCCRGSREERLRFLFDLFSAASQPKHYGTGADGGARDANAAACLSEAELTALKKQVGLFVNTDHLQFQAVPAGPDAKPASRGLLLSEYFEWAELHVSDEALDRALRPFYLLPSPQQEKDKVLTQLMEYVLEEGQVMCLVAGPWWSYWCNYAALTLEDLQRVPERVALGLGKAPPATNGLADGSRPDLETHGGSLASAPIDNAEGGEPASSGGGNGNGRPNKSGIQAGQDVGGGGKERPVPTMLARRPHEMDNSSLQGGAEWEVAPNLELGDDYVLLPKTLWDVMADWYGGAPVFCRQVVKVSTPRLQLPARVKEGKAGHHGNAVVVAAAAAVPTDSLLMVDLYPLALHVLLCDPSGRPSGRERLELTSHHVHVKDLLKEVQDGSRLGGFRRRLPVGVPPLSADEETVLESGDASKPLEDGDPKGGSPRKPKAEDHSGDTRLWVLEISPSGLTDTPRPQTASATIPSSSRPRFSFVGGGLMGVLDPQKGISRWKLVKEEEERMSLSALGLMGGEKVMVESKLPDGTWPRHRYIEKSDFRQFRDGDRVDAMDYQGRWFRGQVVEVGHRSSSKIVDSEGPVGKRKTNRRPRPLPPSDDGGRGGTSQDREQLEHAESAEGGVGRAASSGGAVKSGTAKPSYSSRRGSSEDGGSGGRESGSSRRRMRVRVHFDRFATQWDEWYDSKSLKLAPEFTHTAPLVPAQPVLKPREEGATDAEADEGGSPNAPPAKGAAASGATTIPSKNGAASLPPPVGRFPGDASNGNNWNSRSHSTYPSSRTNGAGPNGNVDGISNFGGGALNRRSNTPGKPPLAGACGLVNVGNTCYLNSAVQCLSHTPLLRAYLLSDMWAAEVNKYNPLGTQGKLVEDFASLLKSLWSQEFLCIFPSKFKRGLIKYKPQFAGNEQQDSQEFLAEMLDALHEDVNRVIDKPYVPAPDGDEAESGRSNQDLADDAWDRHVQRNRSVIVDLFQGQLKMECRCPTCDKKSVTFDPFMYLSVPIPIRNEKMVAVVLLPRIRTRDIVGSGEGAASGEAAGADGEAVEFINPRQLVPVQYGMMLPRMGELSDLKRALSDLCGMPASSLVISATVNNHLVRVLGDKEPLTSVREEDVILAFAMGDRALNKRNPSNTATPAKQAASPSPPPPPNQDATASAGSAEQPAGRVGEGAVSTKVGNEDAARATLLKVVEPYPVTSGVPVAMAVAASDSSGVAETPRARGGSAREQGQEQEPGLDHGLGPAKTVVDVVDDAVAGGGGGGGGGIVGGGSGGGGGDTLSSGSDGEEDTDLEDDRPPEAAVDRRSPDERCMGSFPSRFQDLQLGWRLDALDNQGGWFAATIIGVDSQARRGRDKSSKGSTGDKLDDVKRKTERLITVHFDGFTSKWDECFGEQEWRENKLAPLYSQTRPLKRTVDIAVVHRKTIKVPASSAHAPGGSSLPGGGRGDGSSSRDEVLDGDGREMKDPPPGFVTAKELFGLPFLVRCPPRRSTRYLWRLVVQQASRFVAGSSGSRGFKAGSRDRMAKAAAGASKRPNVTAAWVARAAVGLENGITDQKLAELLPFTIKFVLKDTPLTDSESVELVPDRSKAASSICCSMLILTLEWKDASRDYLDVMTGAFDHPSCLELENNAQSAYSGLTLEQCLDAYTREETLEEEDSWFCSNCREHRRGIMKIDLWKMPDVLVIHMKRFQCSARWREKIRTLVLFPHSGLDMSGFVSSNSAHRNQAGGGQASMVYDLFGVVNHMGGMTGGHYTACCRASPCSKDGVEEVAGCGLEHPWLHFDDEFVEEMAPDKIVSEAAYVLFYRRRRLTPSNVINMTI